MTNGIVVADGRRRWLRHPTYKKQIFVENAKSTYKRISVTNETNERAFFPAKVVAKCLVRRQVVRFFFDSFDAFVVRDATAMQARCECSSINFCE